ncbi:MAG: sulfopyruvate decarboxylase subunit alpha [Methanomassiliicoccales archaeon]|nr:sulfopyruvate decarboxylase subunit alpha [Methanomassiliicoccales archaeon]
MKKGGVNFVASVPCLYLRELLDLINSDKEITHVPVTREEEGIGLCAGAYMGGMRPAIIMQNSGLGNSINALASLDLLYRIPVLMIISHRGVEGERIVAQMPMGKLTKHLLRTLGIPYVSPTLAEVESVVAVEAEKCFNERVPRAVLLSISFWRGL